MSGPEWSVSADEVDQLAEVLRGSAENMRAGFLEATRDPHGNFLFRVTDAGRAHVEQMGKS